MTFITIILWIIICFAIAVYLNFFLFPYIKTKVGFYIMSKKIKRMAKRQADPESKRLLNEVAEGLMEISKNEKLIDEEDD